MSIWLIGAGVMAQDYTRVLEALDLKFQVIGRGIDSAVSFEKATGHFVRSGGLTKALITETAPDKAIIAVGVEHLASIAAELIRAGTKRILIEKPGGLDLAEISNLYQVASEHGATVLLAYNRRFYGSVELARKFIAEDGGLLSAQFEFTEWSHEIAPLTKGIGVKERWILGNSSHVIDLAFHFIGRPTDWKCWHIGTIDWHPAAARFAGAGISNYGVLFSYLADWQAPGRWGLELLTAKRRLILRPMEQLQITKIGSINVEQVELISQFDKQFKPGLFKQTQAFINRDDDLFCTISEQVRNVELYSRMAGYV